MSKSVDCRLCLDERMDLLKGYADFASAENYKTF